MTTKARITKLEKAVPPTTGKRVTGVKQSLAWPGQEQKPTIVTYADGVVEEYPGELPPEAKAWLKGKPVKLVWPGIDKPDDSD